jgi:hypothetical protein
MDLKKRKLKFIEAFLRLENEEAVIKLEKLLIKQRQEDPASNPSPMTVEEVNARIDRSLDDSKKGRLTESSKLKSEIEGWS